VNKGTKGRACEMCDLELQHNFALCRSKRMCSARLPSQAKALLGVRVALGLKVGFEHFEVLTHPGCISGKVVLR
jgi:hypothetical protein